MFRFKQSPSNKMSATKLRSKAARAATYARAQAREAGMSDGEAIDEGERIRREVISEGREKRTDELATAEAILLLEAQGYMVTKRRPVGEKTGQPFNRPVPTATMNDLMAFILQTRTVEAFDPEQRDGAFRLPSKWVCVFEAPRVPALIASIEAMWPRDSSSDWHAFYPTVLQCASDYRALNPGAAFPFGALKTLAVNMAHHFDPDGWQQGQMGWEMLLA